MQEVSAGPLLDGLRKWPRHLNSIGVQYKGNESEFEALQPENYSYQNSYESITGVTVVSSCRLKDIKKLRAQTSFISRDQGHFGGCVDTQRCVQELVRLQFAVPTEKKHICCHSL